MLPAYLRDTKFYHAVAVLVGTMVGVGIYGIPFAFAKAGVWVGSLWMVGLIIIVTLFHLMFAEVVLSTQGVHQVTGYTNIWLGSWGKRFSMVANAISIYGALLAYIIVVGEFLHNILSNYIAVDPQLYSLVFAVVTSLVWMMRVRTIATIEIGFIALYTIGIGLIAIIAVPHIQLQHFTTWTPEFWYLPYGIILFAVGGMSAVPIQRQLLAGKERLMRPAIIAAMAFVAVLYVVFALVIVGVSGDGTSTEAFAGLYGFLGAPAIIIGSLLGVLTIATAYVMLGTALFEMFTIDYRQSSFLSWLLVLLPPVALYLSGFRNFIDILGLVGAVSVGMLAVLLLWAYLRARRMRLRTSELRLNVPTVLVWLLMLFFTIGIIYSFYSR